MQNSNALNKNILILTIVFFALVAALGAMLLFGENPISSPGPIIKSVTVQEIDKNIADVNSIDKNLALIAQEDMVVQELDITLNEVSEISVPAPSFSYDEDNLSDFDSDLADLSEDEKINQEIDQSLQEASL